MDKGDTFVNHTIVHYLCVALLFFFFSLMLWEWPHFNLLGAIKGYSDSHRLGQLYLTVSNDPA